MLRINCIIPKWNGGSFFFDSLKTLREQTYPFSQIVICEDNSNDGSLEKVKALNGVDNLKVVVPETRQAGMGGNVAYGLGFLDDADYTLVGSVDDLWDKDFVRELVEQVLVPAGGGLSGVFSDRWIMDERDVLTGCTGSLRHPLVSSADDWGYYLGACRFIAHGALFKTSYLKKMAPLLRVTGQTADWVLIAEMARLGSLAYYPRPLWRFRIHSTSTSATRKEGHSANIRNYAEYLAGLGEEAAAVKVRALADTMASRADDPASNWARKVGARDPHSRGSKRVLLGRLVHNSGLSGLTRFWLRRRYKAAVK